VSVRKRKWKTANGPREAWVVDYADQEGNRRLKTFKRKTDADAYAATTRVQIGEGTHVPDSASVTVKEAGDLWLATCRRDELEQATLDQYEQHLRLHILPFIGREKLSRMTIPFVVAFQDRLHKEGRSPAMVRGVLVSLGALIGDAQERGLVVRNAVRELRGTRRRRRKGSHHERHNGKLQIGTDIPSTDEVRSLLSAAKGKWRAFILTAVFTGLRASELRGLRWSDVDLAKSELHVRQRADKYNVIGSPKSKGGRRTVPLPPGVVAELSTWKSKCPKKADKPELVFPNGAGHVENHVNIVKRGLIPAMIAAGLTAPVLDKAGKQKRDDDGRRMITAKYTGLHTLRHFFASWCINRKADGGLELPAKVVQERLGHSSITMTMDTYGHLFPRGDDASELAAGEKALLGPLPRVRLKALPGGKAKARASAA
jgi:integrase